MAAFPTGSVDALLDFYGLLTSNSAKDVTPVTYIKAMPQNLHR